MDIRKICIFAASAVVTASCGRDLTVCSPTLEVTAEQTEIKAGESVTFSLDGKTDYLSFWSGEYGSDYRHRDGRTFTPGVKNTVSFSAEITSGVQSGQMSVLVSNSFNGDYMDWDNLIHSGWTDITGWFRLPEGKGKTESTVQDLSAFIYPDRPLYFAFRYLCRPQETSGTASRWVISDLKFTNLSAEGEELTLYGMADSGFRIVDPFSKTDASALSSVSLTQIVMQGHVPQEGESAADYVTEHWAVSRPIDMTSPRETGPDRPEALKGYAESLPSRFTHVYDLPGTYEAVFVASNQSIKESRETVKSILITVTE